MPNWTGRPAAASCSAAIEPDASWTREPGTAGVYLVTDEVDATYDRAVAAGATVLGAPVDRDHGGREFTLADPEGNLWSIGSYRGEPRRNATAS